MEISNNVAMRVVASGLLVLALVIAISHSTSTIHRDSRNAGTMFSAKLSSSEVDQLMRSTKESINAAGGFLFKLSNSYTVRNKTPLGESYPWEYMAEPYRTTTIELQNSQFLPDISDYLDYRWIVDGHLQGTGKSIEMQFPGVKKYEVTVEAYWPGLEDTIPVLYSKTIEVMVKYARREIRQLNDQDREAFFNAVAIIQRVPTKVGQKIYGSNYFSKDHLVRIHLYYGGNFDCDHWHQGPGFVTSHMSYTLMYEKVLQSINPSIAMPYWDFTLESTFYGPTDWRNSPVFSSDWFGEGSPENELHTPTIGRFAYVSTMTNAQEYSGITNAFGLLRAPWNNDPTPFMTRSAYVYGIQNNIKPSGCLEYSKVLTTPNWATLAQQLNAAAHGHIHETVGGSWNHNFGDEVEQITDAVYLVAHAIQALSKILWRTGYVQCPESCDFATDMSSCSCFCPVLQSTDPVENSPFNHFNILKESGILSYAVFYDSEYNLVDNFLSSVDGQAYYKIEGLSEEESGKIYTALLRNLCNPGHIGDMFQATSSNDITFWVLHPTMDRMWHHKRLMIDASNISFDATWEDDTSTCYGHNPDDIQPFTNLFSESRYYTNRELYDLLHPANEDLPYIYADFTWDHCSLLGYDMG